MDKAKLISIAFGMILLCGCEQRAKSVDVQIESPQLAKQSLSVGNQRFVSGQLLHRDILSIRKATASAQRPFAVIVSCSDSRVPPEMVFDQSIGDLFVIRVAGNVLDDITLGSIEYAIEHFHSSLIVVMGHEKCGAIEAVVSNKTQDGLISAIVNKISPSLQKVKQEEISQDRLEIETSIENVRAGIDTLLNDSIIKASVSAGQLQVVGAEYYLSSGKVEWL